MKFIGYTTTYIAIALINSLMHGWAFSVLWKWFIVNTFNLPAISIPVAIGMACMIGFLIPLRSDGNYEKEDFGMLMLKAFLKVLIKVLVALGVGWIAFQFI